MVKAAMNVAGGSYGCPRSEPPQLCEGVAAEETIGLATNAIATTARINSPATLVTTDVLILSGKTIFIIEISFSLTLGVLVVSQ